MDDRLKKLEELNQMLKSELITDSEYKTLLKSVLDSKVEITNESNPNGMQSYSIERLKNAGSNAMYIFYSIIFQIILVFGYWFLIGFKIGYDDATGHSDNFGSLITFVENMDFQEVIEKYDSEKTYFYVYPPYCKTENYYSNHDFDRNDHERLANKLINISGKFSLSYYDFDLLSLWYPKETYTWEMKEFAKAASATKGKTQNMGQELLIMNY